MLYVRQQDPLEKMPGMFSQAFMGGMRDARVVNALKLELSMKYDEAPEGELEADEQVIAWGFEKELKATPETYLYGTALKDKFP